MLRASSALLMVGTVAASCSAEHELAANEPFLDIHDDELPPPGGDRDRPRCATTRPVITDIVPGDCTMTSTAIRPEYEPFALYEIPVVFHVIEQSDGHGAISDELLISQLEVLNEDFRALPGTPGEDGVDSRIEFVIATVDPTGATTSGVDRHVSDDWFHDSGPEVESEMKLALHWDPTRFLNIYVNDAGGGGNLGYATFPQSSAGAYDDGVVLSWAHVGRDAVGGGDFSLGRTATHEIGHYLGLFHSFEGGCGSADEPYTTGDLIGDTVPEKQPHFGCTPSPSECGSGDNPIDNYMNYSDDACMARFTAQQVNRMRCTLTSYRPELYRHVTELRAGFDYTADHVVVRFSDRSIATDGSIVSWQWSFGDGAGSDDPEPMHTYASAGTYMVTLRVTDELGASDEAARRSPCSRQYPMRATSTRARSPTRTQGQAAASARATALRATSSGSRCGGCS